jgi:hypothetical protein
MSVEGALHRRPQPTQLTGVKGSTLEGLQGSGVNDRLRPFTFRLVRDAERREATFYALSKAAALELALAWAQLRGWTVSAT